METAEGGCNADDPMGTVESIAKPNKPQPYSVGTRDAKIGELNDMCKQRCV